MFRKSVVLKQQVARILTIPSAKTTNSCVLTRGFSGLGPLDDAYFHHVSDVGVTGPDKGEGGKYLFVPPGYEGDLPQEGYFVIHSATYMNW